MSTPNKTPITRQEKANCPTSTEAIEPSAAKASSSSRSDCGAAALSRPMAIGSNGSDASEKTALPLVSIA